MGEVKEEETKAEAKPEEKKDEKVEENQEEKKEEKDEDKKEEAAVPPPPPGPPPPTILSVDLHCVGCAKKIKRSIFKCRGVEEVEIDMVQNQVTVKGIVDPQALCSRIKKKTMRTAEVLSPLPPADAEATQPEAAPPQAVHGVATVELLVNMHCEACAQQLRRKILKMRGVQAVETELAAGKATVTGTMNPDRLVEYIHRRTRKFAKVIPPPPPPEKEEEKKEEVEKKPEETPPEEKKEEEKKEENAEKKEQEKAPAEEEFSSAEGGKDDKGGGEEPKQESEALPFTEEDMVKKLAYLYGGGIINYGNYGNYGNNMVSEEEMARRMVHWMPLYVVERRPPPPPQMFSDENPNACSIS